MDKLPQEFLQQMQILLKDEYDSFYQSYQEGRTYGLRANTLKIDPQELRAKVPFELRPVPWTTDGFYYSEEDEPGKHYYYNAGLYYIQDPSAMAPVAMMGIKPGEKVLDLCAAPGGKTVQIGAALQGTGVVVANDIKYKRAKILAMNMERLGLKNVFVTYEKPENLADKFNGYFDRILVDAPCSGEGMFRKMPGIISHWNKEFIGECATMQSDILDQAAKMLKPGGTLVYSTCTFTPEENEKSIQEFINRNNQFEIKSGPTIEGFEGGRPHWIENGSERLNQTFRLWPHKIEGEGHFVALLEKKSGESGQVKSYTSHLTRKELKDYFKFCDENLTNEINGKFTLFGDHLYLTPDLIPAFQGLKVLRPGWYLGELKKNRFQPSYSLAMGLKAEDIERTLELDKEDVKRYLRGETVKADGEKGWTVATVEDYPLGWGKMVGRNFKNYYPRYMRRMY